MFRSLARQDAETVGTRKRMSQGKFQVFGCSSQIQSSLFRLCGDTKDRYLSTVLGLPVLENWSVTSRTWFMNLPITILVCFRGPTHIALHTDRLIDKASTSLPNLRVRSQVFSPILTGFLMFFQVDISRMFPFASSGVVWALPRQMSVLALTFES